MSESAATGVQPGETAVDERNPWLGLASFTEETRAYFYGRDEEVAELAAACQAETSLDAWRRFWG